MPAQRLSDEPVSVQKYDIAGQDADSGSLANFVGHIGLLGDDRRQLRRDDRLPLVHMGPPLGVNEGEHAVHSVYVDIDLLITDEERLPPVDLRLLVAAYPDIAASARFRARFNLQGDGPWKVVLAGYVLNALDRSVEAIQRAPYQPVPGDAFFPRAGT